MITVGMHDAIARYISLVDRVNVGLHVVRFLFHGSERIKCVIIIIWRPCAKQPYGLRIWSHTQSDEVYLCFTHLAFPIQLDAGFPTFWVPVH